MDIVGFIFARGGSKGLKNKNIKYISGKPLIAWSIELAKSVKEIRRLIVSTDSNEIANIAKKYGAEVPFIRPKYLSKDESPEWLAWQHALKYLEKDEGKLPDAMISIPSTSPLREKKDIIKCLKLFSSERIDGVITITQANRNPWFNMIKLNSKGYCKIVNESGSTIYRRQDAKKVYDMTTLAYVLCPSFVLKKKSLFDGKIKAVEVPKIRSLDIDDSYDFEIADYFLSKKSKNNEKN